MNRDCTIRFFGFLPSCCSVSRPTLCGFHGVLPMNNEQVSISPSTFIKIYLQRRQILLCKAVFFISPFVQVHAAKISTSHTAKERHAVLGRSITRSHNITATTRRSDSIHSCNSTRCILPPVVSDVESNHGSPTAGWSSLDQQDLCNLAILSKVLVRAQSRNKLDKTDSQSLY